MSPWLIALLIILAVIAAALIVLTIVGKKAQKKNDEVQKQLAANAQMASILVIDKKRMKIKEAGLPQAVVAQMPKMASLTKVPVVKAKIGPQIVSLLCDEKIFDLIPVKKEVKASISGLYILSVRGVRGPLQKEVKEKKGFFSRFKKDKKDK